MLPGDIRSPDRLPFSASQRALVERTFDSRIFLEGPAGCGKTTVAAARLTGLLRGGVPAESILVLVPHRPLAEPYFQAVRAAGLAGPDDSFDQSEASGPSIVTISGLARRTVTRFWPAIVGPAGFASLRHPPIFINHETAQYVMALVTRPLIEQGYFETVTIERRRIFSQILDNLNRAAGAGFPYTEISRRLKAAWSGEAGVLRAFDNLQECAIRFRQFCLAHNLLDFSLLLEVFTERLWPDPQVQDALARDFPHLIADNLEEDVPATHDVLRLWLPRFTSALLIYDADAGYRLLLGADPQTAYALKDHCDEAITLDQSFVMSPDVGSLAESLIALTPIASDSIPGEVRESTDTQYATRNTESTFLATASLSPIALPGSGLSVHSSRFYPQMLDWAASQVASLIHQDGLPAGEIAVLAPGLHDALLFSLADRLDQEGVPVRSFRPSRPLRDEPSVPCLLTLAALAHPGWFSAPGGGSPASLEAPTRYDLSYALVQAIEGMDLVRAQLLAEIVYRQRDGLPILTTFGAIRPETQERITYPLGEHYDVLWEWLDAYRNGIPQDLDDFWSRLLEEVLLQPGYRFAGNPQARQAAANLVDSARNFRQAVTGGPPAPRKRRGAAAGPGIYPGERPLGLEWLQMIREGIAPAQYLRGWETPEEEAVLIAPAHTFLLTNRPVEVQIWLDAGSRGWAERLYQPLTHPYVMSRGWPEDRPWTDQDEGFASHAALYRLILGLVRRCRRSILVGTSQLSEHGYEQEGPLLRWLQFAW